MTHETLLPTILAELRAVKADVGETLGRVRNVEASYGDIAPQLEAVTARLDAIERRLDFVKVSGIDARTREVERGAKLEREVAALALRVTELEAKAGAAK